MSEMKKKNTTALVMSVLLGISIAWMDTRPHWDDTGISVLMILTSAFICGLLSHRRTWLIALAIGVWIPLFNIISAGNFGSMLAILPAFIGAYTAYFAKKIFIPPHKSQ